MNNKLIVFFIYESTRHAQASSHTSTIYVPQLIIHNSKDLNDASWIISYQIIEIIISYSHLGVESNFSKTT